MCFRAGSLSSLLGVRIYDRVILIAIANNRHGCRHFVKTPLSSVWLIEVMPSFQCFLCTDVSGLDHLGGIYIAMRHGGALLATDLDTDQGLAVSGSCYALTSSLASRCGRRHLGR